MSIPYTPCPARTARTARTAHTAQPSTSTSPAPAPAQPSTGPAPAQPSPAQPASPTRDNIPAQTRARARSQAARVPWGNCGPPRLSDTLSHYFGKFPAQPSSPHRGSIRGSPTHYQDGKAFRINSLRLPLRRPTADNRHQSDRAKPNSQH